MDGSWALYGAVWAQTMAVLVLPRDRLAGLKAFIAIAALLLGELILVSGADGDVLLAVWVLLSSGLLFFAELAARHDNPLVPLMWMASGVDRLPPGRDHRRPLTEGAVDYPAVQTR
jgi:hypothetical protein